MTYEFGDFDQLTYVVLGGLGVAALFAVFALQAVLNPTHRRFKNRLTRVSGRPTKKGPTGTKVSVKRRTHDSSFASLDRLLKAVMPRPAVMRQRLANTGRNLSIGEYVLICFVIFMAATIIVHRFVDLPWLASSLIGVFCGLLLPHMTIGFMISRRLKKFSTIFPEAIDLIVRGLKSGLPVPESLKVVSEELPDPVGIEFRRITDALKMGQTMEEALWEATKTLDTPEFKFFVVSLSVQRETGGNLTETLENLSDIVRKRHQMKNKVRAMSSEARASGMIIGSLPFIMFAIIFILNNDYVMVLFRDPRGMMMVGAGLASLAIGVLIMAKMVRFEI